MQPNEWISVEKELPTGEDRLLCGLDGHGETWMAVGYYNRLMKTWLVNGERYDELAPTHWQPLPEPPKENQ